ncbi:MAG: hypothetical protein FJ011_24600 [Chloroflexi bacterium]|nr:hypothetical protein [Chloroflexota bacterium]
MKPGAPLAVTTFVAGSGGILRFRRVRERVRVKRQLHVFKLPELEDCLVQAGFDNFAPRVFGSFVVVRAVRRDGNPGSAVSERIVVKVAL